MTTRQRAERMITRHPGWSDRQIADKLGCTAATVWKARNADRAAELMRQDNARRRAAKNAWQRRYDRTPEGRGQCEQCGGLLGIGGAHTGSKVCSACIVAEGERKARDFERLWNEGKKLPEIREYFGWSYGRVTGALAEYRAAGYDLPYRYRTYAGRPLGEQVAA